MLRVGPSGARDNCDDRVQQDRITHQRFQPWEFGIQLRQVHSEQPAIQGVAKSLRGGIQGSVRGADEPDHGVRVRGAIH